RGGAAGTLARRTLPALDGCGKSRTSGCNNGRAVHSSLQSEIVCCPLQLQGLLILETLIEYLPRLRQLGPSPTGGPAGPRHPHCWPRRLRRRPKCSRLTAALTSPISHRRQNERRLG